MKTSYDPKCEELARYFLSADALEMDPDITALAGTIQRAIEDWLNDCQDGLTPTAAKEPDDTSGQSEENEHC